MGIQKQLHCLTAFLSQILILQFSPPILCLLAALTPMQVSALSWSPGSLPVVACAHLVHRSLPAQTLTLTHALSELKARFYFFAKLYIQAKSSQNCCHVKNDHVLVLWIVADVLYSAHCGSLRQWRIQGVSENEKLHMKSVSSRAGWLTCETHTCRVTDCKPSTL